MNHAMLARELGVLARCRALMIAVVLHAALLVTFALAWGSGERVPFLSAGTFYDQMLAVDTIVLALLLPWAAVRCMTTERGNDFVLLSAATGIPPSGMLVARAIAVVLALGVLVLSGLPVLLLALRVSAVPSLRVIGEGSALLAVTLVACGTAGVARYHCRGRVVGWLAASFATALLVAVCQTTSPPITAALLAACGTAIVGVHAVRADHSLRFLVEQDA